MIYSIGYQKLTPADLAAVAKALDAIVIDVRSRPGQGRQRTKKGFRRADLEALLGPRYEWLGDVLGGMRDEPIEDIHIGWLSRHFAEDLHCLLLCQEEAPGDCHRHRDIAVPLLMSNVDVRHLFRDEIVRASELQRSIADGDEYEIEAFYEPDSSESVALSP